MELDNIEEIKESINKKLKLLRDEELRLEQALALLTGASPLVMASRNEGDSTARTKKRRYKTARQRSSKTKALSWQPAANAGPWVQSLYDVLADGRTMSTKAIRAHLRGLGWKDVSMAQVSSCLSYMNRSGRLMREGQNWRRKYVRQSPNEPSHDSSADSKPETADTKQKPAESREDVVAKLDKLAQEGKLSKRVGSGGQTVYDLNRPLPPIKH